MFGWIPVVLWLFLVLPPRRAVITAFLVAWLFLPNARYSLPGLPDYTKMSATVLGVLLSTCLFDLDRLLKFRPRWFDMPVVVLCLSPMMSSLLNELGVHDGLSHIFWNMNTWALPYFIGRLYFNTREGLREAALGIFIGGLIYMPLCLWEIRMSPGLHKDLYGFRQHSFRAGARYGGYRPLVFMWSYIPVVHWMTMATLSGFWLWRKSKLERVWGIRTGFLLVGMLITLALCKTLFAAILLPLGIFVLWWGARSRSALPFLLVALFVPFYISIRATGLWSAQQLVDVAILFDERRSQSLNTRIVNENKIAAKALQRPFFGWGRHGRWHVHNEYGKQTSLSDGLWIITLGSQGLVGLACVIAIFTLPLVRFVRRYPPQFWAHPDIAPVALIAVLVLLTYVNNIPNSTINPIVTALIGGLASLERVKRPTEEEKAEKAGRRFYY